MNHGEGTLSPGVRPPPPGVVEICATRLQWPRCRVTAYLLAFVPLSSCRRSAGSCCAATVPMSPGEHLRNIAERPLSYRQACNPVGARSTISSLSPCPNPKNSQVQVVFVVHVSVLCLRVFLFLSLWPFLPLFYLSTGLQISAQLIYLAWNTTRR